MKKFQSIILALVMALGLIPGGMTAGAEGSGLTLDDGYELIDTAYSSTLGYVVAAKDYTKNSAGNPLPVVLYNSKDGVTWEKVYSNSAAYNNANKYSRQQLVWWEDTGAFVISVGNGAVYSNDLKTWTAINNSVRNNAMIETDGNKMMSSGGRATRISAPSTYTGSVQHYCFEENDVYAAAVGMTPADADGNRKYFSAANGYYWLYSDDCNDSTKYFNDVQERVNTEFSSLPYDVKYIDSLSGWIVVNGTSKYYTFTTEAVSAGYTAVDETGITAVGTDGNIVLIGKEDGSLYYASASGVIDGTTEWTKVSGSGMTDEVRSITSSEDGKFIVASKSAVFEITNKNATVSYDVFKEKVEEKFEIGNPVVESASEVNVFDGVKLIGGAYSDELGMYIVYGNTITPETGDYGRIYTSKDGIKWSEALKSRVKFNENSSNGAVWWDKAVANEDGTVSGAFVVSCATNSSGDGKVSQAGWYSKNGVDWFYTTAFELCSDGDIVVNGDYLYTLTDGSVIKRIGALKSDGTADITQIAYTKTSTFTSTPRKLAVSDDANVFMISGGYGSTMTWNVETQTATDINDGNSGGQMMEIMYDNELEYFVGANSYESAIYGLWYENDGDTATTRILTLKPFTADGPKIINLIKQGSKYVVGRVDGGVYVTDGTALSTATVFSEITPEKGKAANAYRVVDTVSGSNGLVLAVAADRTAGTSDALLIDIENKTYKKANDNVTATAYANDEISVSIPYINTTEQIPVLKMITAIYSGKELIQVKLDNVTLSYNENGSLNHTVTVNADAPDNCSIKVILIDDSMVPYLTTVTPVFN